MANGDEAAAAGMDVVPGTSDLREGYDEINKSRDYLAAHMTTGTHDAAAIATGVLDEDRIPAITVAKLPTIPASKISGAWTNDINTNDAIRVGSVQAPSTPTLTSSWRTLYYQHTTGWIGVVDSSQLVKNDLGPASIDLSAFQALQPRRFAYKGDEAQSPRIGAFAEQINEHLPELVVHDEGQPVALHDEQVPWMLVDVVQQLLARIEQLEQRLDRSAE